MWNLRLLWISNTETCETLTSMRWPFFVITATPHWSVARRPPPKLMPRVLYIVLPEWWRYLEPYHNNESNDQLRFAEQCECDISIVATIAAQNMKSAWAFDTTTYVQNHIAHSHSGCWAELHLTKYYFEITKKIRRFAGIMSDWRMRVFYRRQWCTKRLEVESNGTYRKSFTNLSSFVRIDKVRLSWTFMQRLYRIFPFISIAYS